MSRKEPTNRAGSRADFSKLQSLVMPLLFPARSALVRQTPLPGRVLCLQFLHLFDRRTVQPRKDFTQLTGLRCSVNADRPFVDADTATKHLDLEIRRQSAQLLKVQVACKRYQRQILAAFLGRKKIRLNLADQTYLMHPTLNVL